jgi:phosphatidylcholine synthase
MTTPPSSGLRLAAYAVHAFTATGAMLAVLALAATLEGRYDVAFLWLGIAAFVDGIDGTFARWLHVKERAQRFDGAVLDLVVDYVTYVFVPAIILLDGRFLPAPVALPTIAFMCFTAALYFADTSMKMDDGGFKGFPAVWNLVVFYIVAFGVAGWLAVLLIVVLAGLQFAPIPFVHPMRVRRMRAVNIALLVLWSLAALAVLQGWAAPPLWAQAVMIGAGAWFLGVGALSRRRATH